MKHLNKGKKLGRKRGQRRALLKTMLGELLLRKKIKTTEAKAKELGNLAGKIIGKMKAVLAEDKNKRLSALRLVRSQVPRNVSVKNIEDIAKFFLNRKSGFVRILRMEQRKSDGAKMAIIELTEN